MLLKLGGGGGDPRDLLRGRTRLLNRVHGGILWLTATASDPVLVLNFISGGISGMWQQVNFKARCRWRQLPVFFQHTKIYDIATT